MFKIAMVAALAAVTSPALAQGLRGAPAFWLLCGPENHVSDRLATSCATYLGGAFDTARLLASEGFSQLYCGPEYIEPRTLRDITLKYMKEEPAGRTGITAAVLFLALKSAYPCEPPKSPAPDDGR